MNQPNPIDRNLYKGEGERLSLRRRSLPDYEPLDVERSENYLADPDLREAVNLALALGQPLLVAGEPGTGKTRLAHSIAYELELSSPLIFNTKTSSIANDLFYQYDALGHFQDIHIHKESPASTNGVDINDYISYQALGTAILLTDPDNARKANLAKELRERSPTRSVVLIDEIDKAPRDLPNDVLNEIEQMQFRVRELKQTFCIEQRFRPIVILTSNSEKNLPDAFLRRCVFYHIDFPEKERLKEIVEKRFGNASSSANAAIKHFYELRELPWEKKPATAEFLTWLHMLQLHKLDLSRLDPGQMNQKDRETLATTYAVLAKTTEDSMLLKEYLLN